MTRFAATIAALVSLMIAAAPLAAAAGEIRLKNGDRLTGSIERLEEGKLTVRTEVAGQVQVDWSQVSCVVTEEAVAFRTSDETVFAGVAECPQPGVLQVIEPDTGRSQRVALSEVAAVNPPPEIQYRGNVNAGGSASSGNTDSQTLYGSGRVEIRSEKNRLTLGARGNYAENDDTVTARNASGSGKYDYFLTEKLFAYAQTLFEQDRLQDLDLRAAFGAGLGYQFFDTSRLGLYAEAGASYVNEDYETSEDRSYMSGRWSVRFDWQILPDRVKFFHFHEGFVSVEDTQDFYIRSEQGFQLPLIDNFYCNIQMDYDYKNKPATGKKNADLRYLLGVGYSFSNR